MACSLGDNSRAEAASGPGKIIVLVIGHSFVKRLQGFLTSLEHAVHGRNNPVLDNLTFVSEKTIRNWKLDCNIGLNNQYQVFLHGVGGMKLRAPLAVKSLTSAASMRVIEAHKPNVLYVDIGSNDLCRSSLNPECLARHVFSYAEMIVTVYNVDRVILGSVVTRKESFCPYPSYNKNVVSYNLTLANMAAGHPNIAFWKHRGFGSSNIYRPDGVHLNFKGYSSFGRNGSSVSSIESFTSLDTPAKKALGQSNPLTGKTRRTSVLHTPKNKENRIKLSAWSPLPRQKPISLEEEVIACTKRTAKLMK